MTRGQEFLKLLLEVKKLVDKNSEYILVQTSESSFCVMTLEEANKIASSKKSKHKPVRKKSLVK